jgi:secreted trypsin-like serine protease
MATIRLNFTFICDGFLIYDKFIITAAHCIDGLNADQLHVVLGQHEINRIKTDDLYWVESLAIHENFDRINFINDIGIIKLSDPVAFSDQISTLCISQTNPNEIYGQFGVIAGWGRIDNDTSNVLALTLQESLLEINNNYFPCNQTKYDPDLVYCAIDPIINENSNACAGDSGSPLFLKIDNTWFAYGVASYVTVVEINKQIKCVPSDPSYFTKLALYLDWITIKVNEM